jgi:hypothetical protein
VPPADDGTKDKQLVCRHAQNDLHTTTNILVSPLAGTCIKPFTLAVLGRTRNLLRELHGLEVKPIGA